MTTFLDCHQHAVQVLGGVPQEILYDNMKNVVVRRYVGSAQLGSTFLDCCAHYGAAPLACPPYSPWGKGKVERPIDYLRERFWRGYTYTDRSRVNQDVQEWNRTVAMERIHGSTHEQVRLRPERERSHLGPLPLRLYDTSEQVDRKVDKDCQVSFGGNRYVVPHTLVGQAVLLKVKADTLRIFDDDRLVAEYEIPQGRGHLLAHPRCYEALKQDIEQRRRKYQVPCGKAKATLGVSTGWLHEPVQRRPLAVYETLLEVAHV